MSIKKYFKLVLFLLLFQEFSFAQDCAPILKYIDLGGNERVWSSSKGKDKSVYLAGGIDRSFGVSAMFVLKTSETGEPIWSRQIVGSSFEFFRSVAATSDSGAITVGVSKQYPASTAGSAIVIKWDKSGARQWSKAFRTNSPNADYANGVIETNDGGFLITGSQNASGYTSKGLAIKLTKNGDAQWIKLYDAPEGTDMFTAVEMADGFVIAGDYLTNSNTTYRSCVAKVNKSTGNLIAVKSWNLPDNGILNYGFIKQNSDGFYISCTNLSSLNTLGNLKQVVLYLNSTLDLTRAVRIGHGTDKNATLPELDVLPDGSFVSAAGGDNTSDDADFYQISSSGALLWKTRLAGTGSQQIWGSTNINNQDVVFSGVGTNTNGEKNILWLRQKLGNTTNLCETQASDANLQSLVMSTLNFQYDAVTNGDVANWVDVNPVVESDGFSLLAIGCQQNLFDFSYDRSICTPLLIKFIGSETNGSKSYWSFGDGTSVSSTANPTHTYSGYGNYAVKYKPNDCADTVTKLISLSIRPENIIKNNDTVLCSNQPITLSAEAAVEYCWTPATFLNNNTIQNPIANPTSDITYYLTTKTIGGNQITNGDFLLGNTGFSSAYNYASNNVTEGEYFVGTSPQAWNAALSNCGDHTTGNGNMLLVNGSPVPNVVVWKQTIPVLPNTSYEFSTWLQALWPPNPAQLQFAINGIQIGTIFNAQLPTCNWLRFNTIWNSGLNTTAIISIENKNTAIQGNDFALDDISFAPIVFKSDSVKISFSKASIKANNDTIVCNNSQLNLKATGGVSYQWSPTTNLSNPLSDTPVATINAPIQYIVTGKDSKGCLGTDTVNIGTLATPSVSITPKDTLVCLGSALQLSALGGSKYVWSPANTLNNANIPNPIAKPLITTQYKVTVTGANSCTLTDSVMISVKGKQAYSISPDSVSICGGKSVVLKATGGNKYSWLPIAGLNVSNSADVIASPFSSTIYTVQILDTVCKDTAYLISLVTVNSNPVVKLTKSNDVTCTEISAQLNATGASIYKWAQIPGLSNYNIANPIATPPQTATYTVSAIDNNGCESIDSITVFSSSTGDGKLFQMPNAFTPNGDGNNDCFGIRKWGNVSVSYFQIFNRWGQLIFSAKNASDCWFGNFKGQPQPSGNYVYKLLVKTACGDVKKEGSFILIR